MGEEIFDGKYRITGDLGSGGMSSVYRCIDSTLNREVALKLMHTERLFDQASVLRFQREGRAIAMLNHENIVKVHGLHFTPDQQPYLSMEIVDGQSLEKFIEKNGALDCADAVSIARQIASALAYVHSQKIIHRDLKPANIMINDAHKVKLLDFGIAKFIEDQSFKATRTGESIGTPAYMSPEQSVGKAVDARTDQYSLGCVLFEMLTGRPPYTADNSVALTLAHAQEPIPSISKILEKKIPAKLEALVTKLLSKDPDDRYTDMVVVREALSGLEKDTSTGNKQKAPLIATAALVLIIVISGALYASGVLNTRRTTVMSPNAGTRSSASGVSKEPVGERSLAQTIKEDDQKLADYVAEHPEIDNIGQQFKNWAISDEGLKVLPGHKITDVVLHNDIVLTDKCADYLVQLPLTHLALSRTYITDKAVQTFARLQNLYDFDVSGTKISNKSCDYISRMKSLRYLSIARTNINDEGLKKLGAMPRLLYINLNETMVKDLAHSLQANSLDNVRLEGLKLRREDFERLSRLKELHELAVSDAKYEPEDLFILKSPPMNKLFLTRDKITDEQVKRLRERFPKVVFESPHITGINF